MLKSRLPRLIASALVAGFATSTAAQAQLREPDLPERGYRPQTEKAKFWTQIATDTQMAVVGGELITRNDVLALLAREGGLKEDPTEGREGLEPLEAQQIRFFAALEQLVDERLKSQGGKNQGYDPELIAAQQRNYFRARVQELGGYSVATEKIAGWGFTPQTFQDYTSELLYANLWENSIAGRGIGPTGRKMVDDYVRPGQLFALYRDYAGSPNLEQREVVGRTPARATLRQLILAVPSVAETAETRRKALAIQKGIADGVIEFDFAVSEYSPAQFRGDQSRLEDVVVEGLAKGLLQIHPGAEAEIAEFTDGLGEGSLSPVMESKRGVNVDSFRIYLVEDLEPARAATPFVDLELQQRLEKVLVDEIRDVRVKRGLARLARTTYVAPPGLRNDLINRGRRTLRE